MATLAGVGVGGAVGGVVGALVGMGIPEYEAKRYEGAVKNGGTLLSVHCDTSDQIDAAKAGLKETGARDIASTSEEGSTDTTGGRGTFGNIADGAPLVSPSLVSHGSDLNRSTSGLNTTVTDRTFTDELTPGREVITGTTTTRNF